ncbi:3-oxoacyl-ACP synthase III family protein [Amycolatopsis japonica]
MVSVHSNMPPSWGLMSVSAHLPREVVDNRAIERRLDLHDGWIAKRTGILTRRYAGPRETPEFQAVAAARVALDNAGLAPEQLGGLIFATTSPTRLTPGLGYVIQHELGATNASVLDVNAGCAGFMLAFHLACALNSAGQFSGPVLVVGSERFSVSLDPDDRPTAVLFGDGAGAVVLGEVRSEPPCTVLHSAMGSDGHVPEGAEVRIGGKGQLGSTVHMDGRYVAEYISKTFSSVVTTLLDRAGLGLDDIDHVVPHQANIALLREVATSLGIPAAKLRITGDRYGNTGAASIPITLDHHRQAVKAGDTILLVALGGGMNWAGAVLRANTALGDHVASTTTTA